KSSGGCDAETRKGPARTGEGSACQGRQTAAGGRGQVAAETCGNRPGTAGARPARETHWRRDPALPDPGNRGRPAGPAGKPGARGGVRGPLSAPGPACQFGVGAGPAAALRNGFRAQAVPGAARTALDPEGPARLAGAAAPRAGGV